MKIEIDLNDIFHDDDYGSESLQDSVKRQVVDRLAKDFKKRIDIKIDEEISKAIADTISDVLKTTAPRLVDELMDAAYTPVDRYGSRGEKTSFREQVVKGVQQEMVYKKTGYASDANYFTKTVDEVIKSQVDGFKNCFVDKVNAEYLRQTMEFAVKTLKERLGIK